MNTCRHHIETFPVAVEEELQVTDPQTGRLQPGAPAILRRGVLMGFPHMKAETHQCILEITTGPCRGLIELDDKLRGIRSEADEIAIQEGYRLGRGGSCKIPGGNWRLLTDSPHVRKMHEKLGETLTESLFFGLHVHIGITDPGASTYAACALVPSLPILLALSANSRHHLGLDTGMASYRADQLLRIPHAGIPPYLPRQDMYEAHIGKLVESGIIESPMDILWDVRVHPVYETIEVRIMDCPAEPRNTVILAGLIRGLAMEGVQKYQQGDPLPHWDPGTISRNRKQAVIHGMKATLEHLGPGRGSVKKLAQEMAIRLEGFLGWDEQRLITDGMERIIEATGD